MYKGLEKIKALGEAANKKYLMTNLFFFIP